MFKHVMKGSAKICLGLIGWILFLLIAFQFRDRLFFKVKSLFPSSYNSSSWMHILGQKKRSLLASTWKDKRPLVLILGDSQVEMGNWYELFHGQFAVRNAGLSRARIQDVARLADVISHIRPAHVMLFCGINDLGSGQPVDDALDDYYKLLEQLRSEVRIDQLVVISIMPVAKVRLVDGSKDLNLKVQDFNAKLEMHCHQNGITFLNITSAVANGDMLIEELTPDGLHLNANGYSRLAESIRPELSRRYEKAESR